MNRRTELKYIIRGGNRLFGELPVDGSKNCALALLAASVLTDDDVVLTNCPQISDVSVMCKILAAMGKKVVVQKNVVCVGGKTATWLVPPDLGGKLRGSSILLGSLLARFGKAVLPMPGGCAIGSRPMDIHLDGLKRMGVDCSDLCGKLNCQGAVRGTEFNLRFASVGATENLLMAAVLGDGVTVLTNCATEPEVEALEIALCQMGAQIQGVGTDRLEICGVDRLHGVTVDVIPDRIVAATYLASVAAAGGCVKIVGCNPSHFSSFTDLLSSRFDLQVGAGYVKITSDRQPSDYGQIATAPYPLFPTDMQSLALSLAACSASGTTRITENLFENRLRHNACELEKMGANVNVTGNEATIVGTKLVGANVRAGDLRGGAALVVAALAASGVTEIDSVEHVMRGYCDLAGRLGSVGADVVFVP